MSTHYNTEPPPTASIILHTTAGAIPISLFAAQTPLTTRNFLQHCLDGTYDNTLPP
jgi:peptidyl-prolyl cis-trans isomerase SDCCAG10